MSIQLSETDWEKYFWNNKIITSDDCWEWNGKKLPNNYAREYVPFLMSEQYVHRISYWLNNNKIPINKGMVIMHICDNPPCYNPEHLKLGTQKENMQDCVKKGRFMKNRKKLIDPKDLVRSTHCIHGHLFDEKNTYWYTQSGRLQPYRICRACGLNNTWKKRGKI